MKGFHKKQKGYNSTQELMQIEGIDDTFLQTKHGDLVFYEIEPTNLSVLSNEAIHARIHALMILLIDVVNLELFCVNSRETFEENKSYLRTRLTQEIDAPLQTLLEQDLLHLDQIQMQTATARAFYLIVRMEDEKGDTIPYLNRIEKIIHEQGFGVHRAGKAEMKRLLAIYYEQNVTTENFEDIDGQRWVLPE